MAKPTLRARILRARANGWARQLLSYTCLAVVSDGCSEEPSSAPFSHAAGSTSSQDAGPRTADGGAELYASVRDIIDRTCAYERCHSGVPIGAGLPLPTGADHAKALVGVPSCQYPLMLRVKPGDPDNSWIMIKLTAPFRPSADPYANYILFEPPADWDASQRDCRDQTEDGTPLFGQRMPLTAPNMLPEEELETIRSWILAGAPTADR